ncbi:MAG: GDP-mannose 4,6-dehydratase [Opitutaceae bacterium]|nr:GDP-mannose 4,6-dehydratase [Opitutaceae bacterium]
MKVLVTGAAGFIGFHVCQRLLASPQAEVLGVDNLNDYYSVELKTARLKQLEASENFRFAKLDVADSQAVAALHRIHAAVGFEPKMPLDEGLSRFITWFRDWSAQSAHT